MLGDCYASAVVEHLSKKELMALDAAILYTDSPATPNSHSLPAESEFLGKTSLANAVIVEMNNPIRMNGSLKK